MKASSGIQVITSASHALNSVLVFFLIERHPDLEEHFDREEPEHSAGSLACPRSADCQHVAVFANDVLLLVSEVDLEVGDFGE